MTTTLISQRGEQNQEPIFLSNELLIPATTIIATTFIGDGRKEGRVAS